MEGQHWQGLREFSIGEEFVLPTSERFIEWARPWLRTINIHNHNLSTEHILRGSLARL